MSDLKDLLDNTPGLPFRSFQAELQYLEEGNIESIRRTEGPIGKRALEGEPDEDAHPRPRPARSSRTLVKVFSCEAAVRLERESHTVLGDVEDSVTTELLIKSKDKWLYEAGGEYETGSGEPPVFLWTEYRRHFDPERIWRAIQDYDFKLCGRTSLAGAECTILKCTSPPRHVFTPVWAPSQDGDELELWIDISRKFVLSASRHRQGRLLSRYQVTRLVFDEPLEDELFDLAQSSNNLSYGISGRIEQVSLQEAVRRMPFPLFLPPATQELTLPTLHPSMSPEEILAAIEQPPSNHVLAPVVISPPEILGLESRVLLTFARNKDYTRLQISESPLPDPDHYQYEWECIVKGDKEVFLSSPTESDGLTLCRTCCEGTHISIVTDMARDKLLELVVTLQEAREDKRA